MNRQLRVLVVPLEHLAAYARGEARIRNLPMDAEIVAAEGRQGKSLGLLVRSRCYDYVPPREQIPAIPAVIERLAERRAA